MERRSGFTLIELLVVIAIIALLLAVIMPALAKAKSYAEEILCKSNLHQYGIATELYANENDGFMPDPWASLYSKMMFLDETQRFCRWHNPLYDLEAYADKKDDPGPAGKAYAGPYWPYLAVTKANVCPTFSKLATKYGETHMTGNGGASASSCIGGPFEAQFSYSMNALFHRTLNGAVVPVRKSQVVSPSQTFMWAEENMWTLVGFSGYVLNDNALLVSTTSNMDCFSSFHKISKGQLIVQRDSRQFQSGEGVSNVLLVDGSATWLSPEQSIDYIGKVR